jgi:hypothetical protein
MLSLINWSLVGSALRLISPCHGSKSIAAASFSVMMRGFLAFAAALRVFGLVVMYVPLWLRGYAHVIRSSSAMSNVVPFHPTWLEAVEH